MLLQQRPRFDIPREWTCLFFAYCHEFRSRELYDGFILPVEREFKKSSIWLINHEKELREFVLFIKLFVVRKMAIPKNTLERIKRHWIRPGLHKSIGSHLPIYFTVWKLMAPTLSISMHKIKPLFSLVISKLMSAFSLTVQFGVANNQITIIREVLEESLYRLTN